MEQVKEIKKLIKELEQKQGEDYKNFIISLICLERGIKPTNENISILSAIYHKCMSCDFTLLHDIFYDEEVILFDDEERELLGL